ncbi:MAG: TraR/DksA C4-type zinc finger protein, partial [Rubrivivax sp.]|nr:TraR/DksA C4-type zinc finger protein [Rubrivivax sp.]
LAGELREALRRIRVGEFGICERCGDDIDVNRLIAQPTSTVCIDCKRRMESLGRP